MEHGYYWAIAKNSSDYFEIGDTIIIQLTPKGWIICGWEGYIQESDFELISITPIHP